MIRFRRATAQGVRLYHRFATALPINGGTVYPAGAGAVLGALQVLPPRLRWLIPIFASLVLLRGWAIQFMNLFRSKPS